MSHSDSDDDVAQKKNKEAWTALRKFGQPICIISGIGQLVW